MEKKYTIEVSEKQLALIAKALEMHSRMRCGQLEESFLPPIREKIFQAVVKDDNFAHKRAQVEIGLNMIKKSLWPDLDLRQSYGVGHDSEADLGYEMYKEILHQFQKEEQEKCKETGEEYFWNVHSDKPCLKFTDEPTIKINKHE